MKILSLLILVSIFSGCSATRLTVVNTSGAGIKDIEIKAAESVYSLPELAEGEQHSIDLKVKSPVSINVNYSDPLGRRFYASSPVELKPGEGGSLRLSVTAKGSLDAVRKK